MENIHCNKTNKENKKFNQKTHKTRNQKLEQFHGDFKRPQDGFACRIK